MNVFFDFEFTGLHQATTPVSLGMIDENGRRFYAEFTDYNQSQVDHWIKENIVSHLWLHQVSQCNSEYNELLQLTTILGDKAQVAIMAANWLSGYKNVNMWGDCLAYDWVLFCSLFGDAFDIPKNVYYIPFDLSTLLLIIGENPDISRERYSKMLGEKHNALHDAEVIRACYIKAMDTLRTKRYN